MIKLIRTLRHSLGPKLIVTVGVVLCVSIFAWAYFNIDYQKKKMMENILEGTDRLTNTIKLGAHYAMMLNSRDDINQIINNIATLREIKNIRIYNKDGQIKYSNQPVEVDRVTNIKDEACFICHRTEPPMTELALGERTRIIDSREGYRMLGIISPVYNEPGCSTGSCHVHPEDKKVLGALDVVVSLEESDRGIIDFEKRIIMLAATVFVVTAAFIFLFVLRFVNQPIKKLIHGTRRIARGDYSTPLDVEEEGELGQLARAFNNMGRDIGEKQAEVNRQKNEYQSLFEVVPCIITVQDRNYRLIRYNREFAETFDPQPGDFCYRAYKGRTEKCVVCPVEKTFRDGESHVSEETGVNKDGSRAHWIVKTTPVRDEDGNIIAAMEMSLDITQRKQLERRLETSERKYHAIFNSIPNPVFVLDPENLEILDCNDSVTGVYGYTREDILFRSFLDFFPRDERARYAEDIKHTTVINQVRQINKHGKRLFVMLRISPSEYVGKSVLLVTTSDETKRLEAEQQLIQASKMATLGEMATGVAHELNQPLAVIKTASSFFMKKVKKREDIKPEILATMSEEIDSHVDRASRIINHMRQFGRKSDLTLARYQINDTLKSAFEIFSQQLKVRGIDVHWEIDGDLPEIMGDAGRLEQVFINLLINARDAIEEKMKSGAPISEEQYILLRTHCKDGKIEVEVCDTGAGIPPGIADKIFEPFFTTKKVGKGTGLGLSISYGIIQECGGEIRVVPGKAGGTCFVLTFPAADLNHG
jgi:PAS domain S-box-containing protein